MLKKLQRFRLRTVLIVPFLIPIVVSTTLVGWFSFRNGQQAIDDLATQLNREISDRIHQHVLDYFNKSHNVLRVVDAGVQSGAIKLDDFEGLQRYFWQIVRESDLESYLSFGTEQGEFVGVEHREDNTVHLKLRTRATEPIRNTYLLDKQGNRGQFVQKAKYDTTTRPWYRAAKEAGKPTWSEIYPFFSRNKNSLGLSAVRPVYDSTGQMQGVLSIQLTLLRITEFLKTLDISPRGQSFILDRTGNLVVSSTIAEPFVVKGQGDNRDSDRMAATDSKDATVTATARYLRDRFGSFAGIQGGQQLKFPIGGEWYYAQVLPIRDGRGIDWLSVVVVPENDFMARINDNTRTTMWLCGVTFVVAAAIGGLTARWISRQIGVLTDASQEIAGGRLDNPVRLSGIVEIETLADSFNRMAVQLRDSFEVLEAQKDAFARFFPPEYLKFLSKQTVMDIELGDHVSKEMAVMFSDIRSFTTLSEKMTPQETFDFMNAYLRRVSPEIRAHDGFVVKFLGDGVMAVFPNRVDDAIASGIEMLKRVREYNQNRREDGFLPIDVGIGIHVGHVMVGMVGESNRVQGDALSDNVNLTARLEGLTKFYGVSLLVSGEVLERVSDRDRYSVRFVDRAIVQGRTEPIAVYEVLDASPESSRVLKLQTLADFERGLKYYSEGDLGAAQGCFEQVLSVNPLDKTARLYLDRVQQLMDQGIPVGWRGIWAFTQK